MAGVYVCCFVHRFIINLNDRMTVCDRRCFRVNFIGSVLAVLCPPQSLPIPVQLYRVRTDDTGTGRAAGRSGSAGAAGSPDIPVRLYGSINRILH